MICRKKISVVMLMIRLRNRCNCGLEKSGLIWLWIIVSVNRLNGRLVMIMKKIVVGMVVVL